MDQRTKVVDQARKVRKICNDTVNQCNKDVHHEWNEKKNFFLG